MQKDSHYRSLTKAVTWRIAGTLDTIFLSFLVTGQLKTAFFIGSTEVFTKIFLFYFHERIWNVISLGRTPSGPTYYRSLIKSISWRVTGTIDTIVISYIISGSTTMALTIGSTEVITKIVLFYIHERIWSKILWGRVPVYNTNMEK